MLKNYLTFLIIVTYTLNATAQKKTEPTLEEIKLAQALKEVFPDDHVASESENYHITFEYNKRTDKVEVLEKTTQNLINLDSRADIQVYSFYNGESDIESFKIRYKTNRDADFHIQDEAIKSDDLFHNDSRVKYTNLDFPLKGFKYQVEIVKRYKDIKYFTSLYFNDDYPTVKKTFTIDIPNWLDLELKEMNFDGYTINKSVLPDDKNNYKTHTFILENASAMFDDTSSPGPSYIYPHLLVLAKSYTLNGNKINIFESTQDLYNWYKTLVNSLKNDNADIQAKVLDLTQDAKTDEEKIKNIYYWVQDNIRYIAFVDGIAGFKPDEAANVFNKRYGDCKGMANLTKQMLIEAGFDARLTWIGTNRIAYDYSTPSLSVDNHMICTLYNNNKPIYLDGTEKFNAYKEYANRIQGKQVLIENGDEFILKVVPQVNANFNKETVTYELTLENEQLTGTVSKTFNGESRSSLLQYLNQLQTDKKDSFLLWYLNGGNSNIKVENINTSNLTDREIPVNIDYNIQINNAVSSFDNTIYIDLDLEKELSGYNFEKRKTDYVFDYKKHLQSTTTLKIPEGYKIESLPKDIAIANNNYNLKVSFVESNNTLIYKKDFEITKNVVKKTDFTEWNDFIKNLNTLYNEQITLTKQ
ncbi:transglutaminase-like domain-containing protein [Xanthomarina sp.]|uniref:transglutaminase-like domain-containing protein n=1 Tax=Xanthomarina sp. TaxID=1931211 RepID=UPI002CEA59E5|nr:transglutaminase-like domain-containing protein [Xanthomarina sp.]HLV38892.1 transglutaminase-like domain-containing protein [Xanthomarina sp.]